jgi:hypothetical protein
MSGMPPPPPGGRLLGSLGDDGLGREDVLGDRRGVLERRARDHGRVDDARLDQILDLAGVDVQAHAGARIPHLVDDDRRLEAGVLGELPDRLLERTLDDLRARPFVGDLDAVEVDRLDRIQERDTAAGTMPSSSAARVAWTASSTRCFFSFISVSVARRP